MDPTPITTEAELDYAWRESSERPVLIFKHSTRCGVSAHAFQGFRDWLSESAPQDPLYTVVDVREARPVSNAIEERTGVRHESPQVILLRHGDVAWNASHWQVTPEAVEAALAGVESA